MLVLNGIIRRFGEIVDQSKDNTLNALNNGEIQDESAITGRFLAFLVNEINQHGREMIGTEGIRITSSILTDRGFSSAESRFGADFGVILDINIDGFTLKKGFICQAKRETNSITIRHHQFRTSVLFNDNQQLTRLQRQIENMLTITPDSFVIIYGQNEFVMVPAISISGLDTSGELYGKQVSKFFKDFLMCFIGDRRLTRNPEDWAEIKTSTAQILSIEIKQKY